MRSAAKTMIELLGGANGKTGGFFIVKRTAGRVIRTRFFQWHAFINHIDNVNAIEYVLNKTFRNQNVFCAIDVITAKIGKSIILEGS